MVVELEVGNSRQQDNFQAAGCESQDKVAEPRPKRYDVIRTACGYWCMGHEKGITAGLLMDKADKPLDEADQPLDENGPLRCGG